ncbi:hypothetical protein [Scytonema sp. PCC 10023]|uniref:hypothetical protein n=1 Tax=Scytonema sp. PCC 10023 TaxID=1680591 RepID=UPI0039C61741
MSKLSIKSNAVYFIRNYKHNQARLAQFEKNEYLPGSKIYTKWGTFANGIYEDQLWILKEALPHYPNSFYIVNWTSNHRLTYLTEMPQLTKPYDGFTSLLELSKELYGLKDIPKKAILFGGDFFENQLWRFSEAGDNSYRIINYTNPRAKLAKWGKSDQDCGVYDSDDSLYDDQRWVLEPRFYNVEEVKNLVYEMRNAGSLPDEIKRSVEHGFTQVNIDSVKEVSSFKASAEVSFELKNVSSTVRTEFSKEIEIITSRQTTKSYSERTEKSFICPPKTLKAWYQKQLNFKSYIEEHNCSLLLNNLETDEKPL